ncbi:hypothetical protein HHI36_000826 [Cryptolaemus montrouzieri]|uniref:Translocon-associated protein subunit delta n=1 Tax=Cryptolaemus montrouzieri TaxID=559131 RepID=A0ABD2P6I5_9CUCU
MSKLFLLGVFFSCLTFVFCEKCVNPQITSSSFTTDDATYLTNIAYIGVFEVKCESNDEIRNLYADINGNLAPVSIVDKNKFQISWTESVKKASSGEKIVRIYREDDVPAFKRALKSGEDVSSVPTLGSVVIKYNGAYNGPYVQGEFLALVVSSVAAYFAIASRIQITS